MVENPSSKAGEAGVTPGWGTKSPRAAEQLSSGAIVGVPVRCTSGPRLPWLRLDTAK